MAGGAMTLTIAVIVATLVVCFGTFIGVMAAMQTGRRARAFDLLINCLGYSWASFGRRHCSLRATRAPDDDFSIESDRVGLDGPLMKAQAASLRERDFVVASKLRANQPGASCSTILSRIFYRLWLRLLLEEQPMRWARVGLEFLGLGDLSVVTWGTNLYWAQMTGLS